MPFTLAERSSGRRPPPWVVDSHGMSVPTHFEVEGGANLVQIIEHRGGDYTYGIVADPWWPPSREAPTPSLASPVVDCPVS